MYQYVRNQTMSNNEQMKSRDYLQYYIVIRRNNKRFLDTRVYH